MAATFAYSAATKCNILALKGPRVVQLCSHQRFTAIQRSAKFPIGRGTALFCTSPPNQEVVVLAEEDQPPPRQSIKELADMLDIRVGRVVKAWRHEEADSLYVEEVDVGEPEPRVICSGLVAHVPLEHLQGLSVVVLANLKPRNMRGVKSSGMLLAASDSSHSTVELLVPPPGSLPGHRIWFDRNHDHDHDHDHHDQDRDDGDCDLPVPATPNQIQKKKVWEAVQPHLKTDGDCVAGLSPGYVMRTPAGVVRSPSLSNANIS